MSAEIDPFHAISVSRLAHALKAEGRSILHMEFGQPSTGAPRAAIETAHRVLDSDGMGYWESPALKARLARHYDETYGVKVDPE
ncbi:MAG TPA: aminotransferase, partial [Caulobacteraceae bacterium]